MDHLDTRPLADVPHRELIKNVWISTGEICDYQIVFPEPLKHMRADNPGCRHLVRPSRRVVSTIVQYRVYYVLQQPVRLFPLRTVRFANSRNEKCPFAHAPNLTSIRKVPTP